MAIFGFHFVLTLVAATIFTKTTQRFSLCDWAVLKGLYYYLLESSLLPKNVSNTKATQVWKREKRKKISNDNGKDDQVEGQAIRLVRLSLTSNALEGVPFFSSLTRTIDYFIIALLVYFISDLFAFFFPQNEDRNISLTWLLCSLIFLTHVLAKLTALKMSLSELSAERNLILSFAAIFFLLSMIFTLFMDDFMDIAFQQGYRHFTSSIDEYLNAEGFKSIFPTEDKIPLLLFITLSLIFSALAAIFLFPNFQYASLFLDSMEKSSPVTKAALYTTFFLPLISFLTFMKPVKRYVMVSMKMTDDCFDTFRILIIFTWVVMRCATAKIHLQTFLDTPKRKITEFTQKHMKDEERQRKVAHYASYSCVSLLQYFVPVLITLVVALLLKSLGDIRLKSLMNTHATSSQQNSRKDNGALQSFLDVGIQKAFWTLLTTACLGINSVLSVCGVFFKRTLLSRS